MLFTVSICRRVKPLFDSTRGGTVGSFFGWRESVGSEALRHVDGFLPRCDRWLRANCDQPNLEAYASDHTLFYATGQRHRQSFAEMDVTRSGTSFTSWIVQLCFLRASTLGSCYLFTEPKVVYDETC